MRFMLTCTWKQQPNEEIMALMPAEQDRERELVEQGISESAHMAADRSTFWTVWNRASQDEVHETLQTLPLYRFLNVSVAPLAK